MLESLPIIPDMCLPRKAATSPSSVSMAGWRVTTGAAMTSLSCSGSCQAGRTAPGIASAMGFSTKLDDGVVKLRDGLSTRGSKKGEGPVVHTSD